MTESFAFLLEHLTEDRDWLRERLGVEDPEAAVAHARAVKLVLLRRYAAKLAYELELHGGSAALDEMPDALRGAARRRATDSLAAGELAGRRRRGLLRRLLPAGLGARDAVAGRASQSGSASLVRLAREAGEWLRALWREGQRLDADELLAETRGRRARLRRGLAEAV